MELLVKIILKKPIEDEDITNAMYEVCDAVHASCNPECPVFAINNEIPMNEKRTNCSCFNNGQAMIDEVGLFDVGGDYQIINQYKDDMTIHSVIVITQDEKRHEEIVTFIRSQLLSVCVNFKTEAVKEIIR